MKTSHSLLAFCIMAVCASALPLKTAGIAKRDVHSTVAIDDGAAGIWMSERDPEEAAPAEPFFLVDTDVGNAKRQKEAAPAEPFFLVDSDVENAGAA
ncbi:hypothetical protein DFH06DRAFT_254492 [Mycena polygramma]|nr:hypothetical protein DFH06DRAFT_1487057 [Mycena polygramma]KAJ7605965.1 hypothetical protein DFH06DRAFT_254492 [Mycena polygramma]